jgi:DNA-binding transcriptional regulator YdaS (Cro superfamily)
MTRQLITRKQAVIAAGGTQAALARALGITPSAVCQWPTFVPERYVEAVIEKFPDVRRAREVRQ